VADRTRHPFADVDAQDDPPAWVAVLDRLRCHPAYAAYKARGAELLEPGPEGRYLDIGCGTGADALQLAGQAGCSVAGVDRSQTMIGEARRRGLTDAVVADAPQLPFPADEFDGAWADRTFQHLADPPAALAELVRVVRPGGTVVIADPDYATQVVNIPDQELAERVLGFRAGVGHWRLAHQMPRLCAEAGLADILVEAVPIVLQDPASLDNALGLRSWARVAHEQGDLAHDDVGAWEASIDQAAAGGWFLYSFSIFITRARKRPHA
jgi:SAM-dependent methyltransferase